LPGAGVIEVLGGELRFVSPGLAIDSGAWIKNAAKLQIGTARSGVLVRIGTQQVAAIAVARGQVVDAVIGAIVDVRRGVGHKAAVVGAGRGDPAGGGVDRVGRAVQITGKVVPAQFTHGVVAPRVVGGIDVGAGQVHLAD